jgi:hypothetical protein
MEEIIYTGDYCYTCFFMCVLAYPEFYFSIMKTINVSSVAMAEAIKLQ